MLTDRQVVLMRQKLMKGKTQQAAAAASDMSERSVRNWNKGPLPSEKKDRRRKSTRPDPFAGVWAEEVEPLLEADVDRILAAPTVLEWLDERHPGRFNASHLRTLQRRIRDWRALNGPEREVYFEQKHPPGREAQMDFTHCDSLKVTIGGEPFEHMVFEFILSHSGWRYAQICYSETFVALVSGLQGALWELGAAPEVVRSDNLSAATHKLKDGKGRDFNERYKEILDHYGLKATRTNSYSAHENGVAEQGHRRLKDSIQLVQCARERSCRAGTPPSEGLHSAGAGPQGQLRLRVGGAVHEVRPGPSGQAQQAGQGEGGERVPAPEGAASRPGSRVPELQL